MKTSHVIFARLSALLFVLLFCSTAFAGSTKVDICHIPPGDEDNYHTIRISEKAANSHFAHGDLPGVCEEDAGCPCFTADELAAAGTPSLCVGEDDWSFAVYDNESFVCSGFGECPDIATEAPPSCYLLDASDINEVLESSESMLTEEEDANCRTLISTNLLCPGS